MPIYRITESRTFYRTYQIEKENAEDAVEEYEDGELVDEETNIDTDVVAVEDEKGSPVGEWVVSDPRGNSSAGYSTREEALDNEGAFPTWFATDDEENN